MTERLDPMTFWIVIALLIIVGIFAIYMNDKIKESERQRKQLEERLLEQCHSSQN